MMDSKPICIIYVSIITIIGVATLSWAKPIEYKMKEPMYYKDNFSIELCNALRERDRFNGKGNSSLSSFMQHVLALDACEGWLEYIKLNPMEHDTLPQNIIGSTNLTSAFKVRNLRCLDEFSVPKTTSIESITAFVYCINDWPQCQLDKFMDKIKPITIDNWLDSVLMDAKFNETQATQLMDNLSDFYPQIRSKQYALFTAMSGRQNSSRVCDLDSAPDQLANRANDLLRDVKQWQQQQHLQCNVEHLDSIDNYFKCLNVAPGTEYDRVTRQLLINIRPMLSACIDYVFDAYDKRRSDDDQSSQRQPHSDGTIDEPLKQLLETMGVFLRHHEPQTNDEIAKQLIEAVRDARLSDERNLLLAYANSTTNRDERNKVISRLSKFAQSTDFKQKLWDTCNPLSQINVVEQSEQRYQPYLTRYSQHSVVVNVKRLLPLLFRCVHHDRYFSKQRQHMRKAIETRRNRQLVYAVFACNVLGLASINEAKGAIIVSPNYQEFAAGWITDFLSLGVPREVVRL